jgi:citronellol/citronellal dehydrogenase
MGYPMRVPDAAVQARDAVKPFNGFHRAETPKVFQVQSPTTPAK